MFEVFVLVPVRKSIWVKLASIVSLMLAVVSMLLACGSGIFAILFVLFAGLWYVLTFQFYKEYEYSYFDGEVRFARVMNKSRRKTLEVYSMDEVVTIAPAGERSVYDYENDNSVQVKDYTSHKKDTPYYDLVIKKEAGTLLIKYEPDDEYLDAVQVKYAQKVVRRQA